MAEAWAKGDWGYLFGLYGPGGETSRGRNVHGANWQSGEKSSDVMVSGSNFQKKIFQTSIFSASTTTRKIR